MSQEGLAVTPYPAPVRCGVRGNILQKTRSSGSDQINHTYDSAKLVTSYKFLRQKVIGLGGVILACG